MATYTLSAVLGGLALLAAGGCHRVAPEREVVTAQGEAVTIGLERIAEGKAHFFTYKHRGKNVNFFLRRDGTGRYRAHFDACYGCYRYKRGYVQDGPQVVCVACRIGYDLATPIWEFVGPCVPIDLKCRVQGSSVVLPVSAVERGVRFF